MDVAFTERILRFRRYVDKHVAFVCCLCACHGRRKNSRPGKTTNLRFRKLHRWGTFASKYSIHKHSILSVAFHKEMWMFTVDFDVNSRDKTRMSHVYIYFAFAAIATYADFCLTHNILKVPTFQPCNARSFWFWTPWNSWRAWGRRFKGQQRPGIVIWRALNLRHRATESTPKWQPQKENNLPRTRVYISI